MQMAKLSHEDGSWDRFETDWEAQCEVVGESLDNFSPASVAMIRSFSSANDKDQWALALKDGGRVMAIACGIRTRQKGFSGFVLRVREITVCPLLDYGELEESEYVLTLIELLNGAVKVSERDLRAKHIKMHLRSPEDAKFFRAVGTALDTSGAFEAIEYNGAWLTITKK